MRLKKWLVPRIVFCRRKPILVHFHMVDHGDTHITIYTFTSGIFHEESRPNRHLQMESIPLKFSIIRQLSRTETQRYIWLRSIKIRWCGYRTELYTRKHVCVWNTIPSAWMHNIFLFALLRIALYNVYADCWQIVKYMNVETDLKNPFGLLKIVLAFVCVSECVRERKLSTYPTWKKKHRCWDGISNFIPFHIHVHCIRYGLQPLLRRQM